MVDRQWDTDEDKRTSPKKHPALTDILNKITQQNPDQALLQDRLSSQKSTKDKKSKSRTEFTFSGVSHGVDSTHHVAKGYRADVLIRWGDPVTNDAPDFDPENQTAFAQARQFGYNNDFVGFMPLPRGSHNPSRGLLVVNHEYTSQKLMFPEYNLKKGKKEDYKRELCDIEMAAHGLSVVEIEKDKKGRWHKVRFSPYNRRITPLTSTTDISGPAVAHERMKTQYDPKGRHVLGTVNNCAGGITPWGTILTTEENFNGYFSGVKKGHPEKDKLKRYGIPGKWFDWGEYHERFNIEQEPNEPNRFGWFVELDPYDPYSRPVKRTALGRFKHEGAAIIQNIDDKMVVYSADDQTGEYIYKFVSKNCFDANDRRANFKLFDEGVLYVARFDTEGAVQWLPLVYGEGPLTEENGFNSQADVLIDARQAADTLGATPLDRPEDVIVNQKTGAVYIMLLGDNVQDSVQEGRILELKPKNNDHGTENAQWSILLHSDGINSDSKDKEKDKKGVKEGWFIAPDNGVVDHRGRLWVTTDQGEHWGETGSSDGIWAVETRGKKRGAARMFFRVPVGAEMASPAFTPDDKTMFIAVQHPGSDSAKEFPEFSRESTFSNPITRWPDFDLKMPPRPAIVVISKKDGGVIGS